MTNYFLAYHLVVTMSSTLQTHFIFSSMNSLVQKLSLPPLVPSISWWTVFGAVTFIVVITFLPSAVTSSNCLSISNLHSVVLTRLSRLHGPDVSLLAEGDEGLTLVTEFPHKITHSQCPHELVKVLAISELIFAWNQVSFHILIWYWSVGSVEEKQEWPTGCKKFMFHEPYSAGLPLHIINIWMIGQFGTTINEPIESMLI